LPSTPYARIPRKSSSCTSVGRPSHFVTRTPSGWRCILDRPDIGRHTRALTGSVGARPRLSFREVVEPPRRRIGEIDVRELAETLEDVLPDGARRAPPFTRLAKIANGETDAVIAHRSPHDRRELRHLDVERLSGGVDPLADVSIQLLCIARDDRLE